MPRTNISVLKESIRKGNLEKWWIEESKSGARLLMLKFFGQAYPEAVSNPEYQRDLKDLLDEFDRQSMQSPPAQYADCNGYVAEVGKCKILTEMFCVTRGSCKFYKAKGAQNDNWPY